MSNQGNKISSYIFFSTIRFLPSPHTFYERNFNLIIKFASSSAEPSFVDVPLLSLTFLTKTLLVYAISAALSLFALNKFISTKNPSKSKNHYPLIYASLSTDILAHQNFNCKVVMANSLISILNTLVLPSFLSNIYNSASNFLYVSASRLLLVTDLSQVVISFTTAMLVHQNFNCKVVMANSFISILNALVLSSFLSNTYNSTSDFLYVSVPQLQSVSHF